jgi:hypothetical protein
LAVPYLTSIETWRSCRIKGAEFEIEGMTDVLVTKRAPV